MKHIGVGLLMSGLVNVEVGSFFYHVKFSFLHAVSLPRPLVHFIAASHFIPHSTHLCCV